MSARAFLGPQLWRRQWHRRLLRRWLATLKSHVVLATVPCTERHLELRTPKLPTNPVSKWTILGWIILGSFHVCHSYIYIYIVCVFPYSKHCARVATRPYRCSALSFRILLFRKSPPTRRRRISNLCQVETGDETGDRWKITSFILSFPIKTGDFP